MVIPVGERYQQTLYLMKKRRQAGVRGAAADAVRADDRQGRGRAAKCCPTRPSRPSKTAASRASRAIRRSPTGWHYQRQLEIVAGKDAPRRQELRHLQQHAARPRQPGLARLRRRRPESRRSCSFRRGSAARTFEPGQTQRAIARHRHRLLRREPSHARRGRLGSLARHVRLAGRDASGSTCPRKPARPIMRIGLLGATGEISFDDIELKAVKK